MASLKNINKDKFLEIIMKLKWKFLIFCIIGVLSALVDLAVFNILFWGKLNFIVCRIIAVFGAVMFNFFLNRHITFRVKEKSFKKQFPKHIIVYSLVIITNVVVSTLTVNFLGEGTFFANIASVAGIISGIPISFFGSLLWTFKNKES